MSNQDFSINDKVWWKSKPDFMDSESIEHGIIESITNNYMSIKWYDNVNITAKKKSNKWFVFRLNSEYLEELFKGE